MQRWRLIWGSCFALISLLAIFRAPAKLLWFLAVGVTEWGPFFALLALVAIWPGWKNTQNGCWGAGLSIGAALLFFTPLLRAIPVASALPQRLIDAFGSSSPHSCPEAPARMAPLAFSDLWRGLKSPPVQRSTWVYAAPEGQALRLDVYRPDQTQRRWPAVLVVHGGSWQSGDRNEFLALNHYLAARGYLVVAADYRLAPAWTFPAAVNDIRAAVGFLKLHASELGFDGQHVVLFGRSAGGQIALMAAYQNPDPILCGAIDFYAPADMNYGYSVPSNPLIMNSRRVMDDYMGGPPSHFPDGFTSGSPLEWVGPQSPPTLIVHGSRDELVWPVHSEHLSAKLTSVGVKNYYLRLPWATHGCDFNLSTPSGQIVTYAVERFLSIVTR